MNTTPNPTRIRPIVKRPGGKSRMLATLLPMINAHAHRVYIEPFCGGAAVLAAKQPSEHEILNDLDGDMVNLYRQVKYHADELVREMQWMIESRKDFCDFRTQPGLTEIQRAARWCYRNFYSFAGDNDSFGVKRLGFNTRSYLLAKISGFHVRLDRVTIENLTWQRCIQLYDCKEALIFCDPPYTAGEVRSYAPWTDKDVSELATALRGAQGSWIVTLNDCPANRFIFRSTIKGCRIQAVTTNANMSNAHEGCGRRFGEIIIRPSR
jgi:DNA adenine methylase